MNRGVALVGAGMATAAGLMLWRGNVTGSSPSAGSPRDRLVALIKEWIPSEMGDGRFEQLLGAPTGDKAWQYYTVGFGTSCAVVVAALLAKIGCAPKLLNMHPSDGGSGHVPGATITKLIQGAKDVGAWRAGPSLNGIREGDVYVLATPPKGTDAHTGFWLERSGDWVFTADAGQRDKEGEQAARIVRRKIVGDTMSGPEGLGPFRPIQGYVDIDAACQKVA